MKRFTSIDHAAQEMHEWLNEITNIAGWEDGARSFAALRASLRLLRDNLPLVSAANLAAELPPLIRGFYYENWRPSDQPLRERSVGAFIAHLYQLLCEYNHPEIDPEIAATSVYQVLNSKISFDEVKKIYLHLPRSIKKLYLAE